VYVFALEQVTIFGIAAAVSSLIGVGLSIAGYRSGREAATNKVNAEQHEQLLAVRAESERLSLELHEMRMRLEGQEEKG
jgi:hypothetical protein